MRNALRSRDAIIALPPRRSKALTDPALLPGASVRVTRNVSACTFKISPCASHATGDARSCGSQAWQPPEEPATLLNPGGGFARSVPRRQARRQTGGQDFKTEGRWD